MKIDRKFLFELLSQPTAPYRESFVMQVIEEQLRRHRVPFFKDPVGNRIVGVSNRKEYLARVGGNRKVPVKIFMAHTDHPGFHGMKWERKTRNGHIATNLLSIHWHGGSPKSHLEGAPVWLAANNGFRGEGILSAAKLNKRGTAITSGMVKTQGDFPPIEAGELFGGFKFRKPIWQDGELLYTKAADDLIGCFAIVSLAIQRKKDCNFLGLLTRAEEVGFIGAIGHFELGWLSKARGDVLCISLETSRTLPGAEIGKGPVVRLGDRMTIFDPAGLDLLWGVAKKGLRQFQRRIMDGGACEASASTAYGIRSIGISVPLGNYHNQSLQGGPDSRGPDGPAPEYVHIDDLKGMMTLCHALAEAKFSFDDPWRDRRRAFASEFRNAQKLLELD